MTSIARFASAFGALGSALVTLAIGAAAPFPLAAMLLVTGTAQAVGGVLVLRGAGTRTAGVLLAAVAAPQIAWAAMLMFDLPGLESVPPLPMLGAALLGLPAATTALALARRPGGDTSELRPVSGLLGVLASAVVVAAIATPALAGTAAGELAVPHGEHAALTLTPDDHGH